MQYHQTQYRKIYVLIFSYSIFVLCILKTLMDAITQHVMLRKTSVSTWYISSCAGNGAQFLFFFLQDITSKSILAQAWCRASSPGLSIVIYARTSLRWIRSHKVMDIQRDLHKIQGLQCHFSTTPPWYSCQSNKRWPRRHKHTHTPLTAVKFILENTPSDRHKNTNSY